MREVDLERIRPLREQRDGIGLGAEAAPIFHRDLNRHIRLDKDFYGPLSMSLLEALCKRSPEGNDEAEVAAEEAIRARIRFWDGVRDAIEIARVEAQAHAA